MKARYSLLAAVALVGFCLPARAGFVNTVTTGADNLYEDISREHVFFNGAAGAGLSVGDTVVGFSQITQKGAPNSVPVGSSLVAVFGLEITAVSGNTITFGAITAAHSSQSLQTLLGMPTLPSTTMAVVFDKPSGGIDYTLGAPSGVTDIGGYLASIKANYNYDFAAGITIADNFFSGTADLSPSLITASTLNSTGSLTPLGSFSGALSVVQNNLPQFVFAPVSSGILNPNTGTLVHPQLSVLRGALAGANDIPGYAEFGTPGVSDNASFGVHPNLSPTPEPASVVLFGLGLSGLFGAVYRRSRKATVSA